MIRAQPRLPKSARNPYAAREHATRHRPRRLVHRHERQGPSLRRLDRGQLRLAMPDRRGQAFQQIDHAAPVQQPRVRVRPPRRLQLRVDPLRAPFLRRPGAQGVFGFLDGLQHDLPIAQDGRGQFGSRAPATARRKPQSSSGRVKDSPPDAWVLRPGKGLLVRLPVIWISPDRVRRGYSSAIDTRSSAAACSTCCSARRMSGRTRTISAGSGAVGSPRGRGWPADASSPARSGSLQ